MGCDAATQCNDHVSFVLRIRVLEVAPTLPFPWIGNWAIFCILEILLAQNQMVLVFDSGVLVIYEDALVKSIFVKERTRLVVGILEICEPLVVSYHKLLMLLILRCKHSILPIFEVPLLRIDDFQDGMDVVLQAMRVGVDVAERSNEL